MRFRAFRGYRPNRICSHPLEDEGVKSENDEGVNDGVKTLLDVVRSSPGNRANELATLIGKSVQTVERYVKSLKDAGKVEFRGAPKNGGYYATDKE